MKLAHPDMETVIELDYEHIATLVVENRSFFRKLLEDISGQCAGKKGELVLSEGLKLLEFTKYAEIIDGYYCFSVNRKPLQTKLLSAMEKTALNESYYLKTSELLQQIERLVNEITVDYTTELYCDKLTIGSLLKSIGIAIQEDNESVLERMLDYLELTREFDREKLFFFVNLRSFFSDEELTPFLNTILAQGYRVLLLDSHGGALLPMEKRLTVDEDLCEF